jgi:hypothetical protein
LAAVIVVGIFSRSTPTRDSRVVVPGNGKQWVAEADGRLSTLRRHRTELLSELVLVVRHDRHPPWTIAAVIFLFPLGLLALLHTVTDTATITVAENGPPAVLRLQGQFSTKAVTIINELIPS